MPDGPTPANLEFIQTNKPWDDDALLVEANVIDDTNDTSTARHDSVKLSNAIAEAYRKYRGRRRRLPRVRLNVTRRRPDSDLGNSNGNGEAQPVSFQEK
jgi:hypothetical protein